VSLQSMIDEQLMAEQEKRKTRERSGLWTPGKFGRCFRFQFWSRKKEPESNFPELKMLRRWKVGNLYHEYAQSFFPKECREKEIKVEDIIGYADIVLEEQVIDIKSVDDYQFKYLVVPNYDVEKQKEPNCFQVSTYAWLLKKPRASLYFISTMSSASIEFDVKMEHFIPKIEEELKTLRDYWSKDELPPAKPRAYAGKECQYCDYSTTCQKQEEK
jgi:CRISPR/Cas system-associated exonuclease Cas4 (RecB family)